MQDSKKQNIVIAVLIVLIVCAAWFSKVFNDKAGDVNTISKEANETKTSENFFVEGRMSKENARSAFTQELNKIIKDDSQTKEAKESATVKLMALYNRGTKENEIETLVKQRGYEDALCFIEETGVEITVKSEEALTTEEANKIKDVVVRITSIAPSNIVVRYQ